nr:MAG TPA: hypothetical protein [Bacteriophage sp.]
MSRDDSGSFTVQSVPEPRASWLRVLMERATLRLCVIMSATAQVTHLARRAQLI